MPLNTTRSCVAHIYVTSIHESQISLHFTLRPTIFEIQAIFRQVLGMTPNWPWTPQDQITLYMYNNCLRASNFTPLRFTTSRLQAILRQVNRMTPKWPWTLQDQRYTTYVLLVSPSPKLHSVLLYDQPFSKYRTFYNSPLSTMLNGPKKNKKGQKFKISNFTVLLTLSETLPMSIHEF